MDSPISLKEGLRGVRVWAIFSTPICKEIMVSFSRNKMNTIYFITLVFYLTKRGNEMKREFNSTSFTLINDRNVVCSKVLKSERAF